MPNELVVRLREGRAAVDLPATLGGTGLAAARAFSVAKASPGVHLLLGGDRSYFVTLRSKVSAEGVRLLGALRGKLVQAVFPGRSAVRRRLLDLAINEAAPRAGAIELWSGLWLHADGTFATSAAAAATGIGARDALVAAARWVSTRRTTTFERLFAPSAFHPDEAVRTERLSVAQAGGLLAQIEGALAAAAVGSGEAKRDPEGAAVVRSAAATVLSHLLATVKNDPGFRAVADEAAERLFGLIEGEGGDATARPSLRAHAIQLLALRGPALLAEDQRRATTLLRGLVRERPPYAEMTGPWRFAMCSDHEFHDGECDVLIKNHGFREVPTPSEGPACPAGVGERYRVFEAPFKNRRGLAVQIYARSASPMNENLEMAEALFVGLLINRHAQLGSFDMRASSVPVRQQGYKLMMNSQCAGLTTRFAISRMFPDADIYSSWDSTYFNTDPATGRVAGSEGLDCFVAVLDGMAHGETHVGLEKRIRGAQWSHKQAWAAHDFVQFVGPGNPLVVGRFNDINHDGRADLYDGFLDFHLRAIAEDILASATPRDPGVAPSQVAGEASAGLDWAANSLDRVAQYSDIWAGLPGAAENLYAFQAGGFYSHREPPGDLAVGSLAQDLGRLPALCRYRRDGSDAGLQVEVMLHAWLAHSAKELKRLLCAAEALWRAFDTGFLPTLGALATPLGQRAAVLLTLAGLLDFPADQNHLDGLWSMALKLLNLPEISRSVVRGCITHADHDASNYYGSYRGLVQLVGDGASDLGDLGRADALAHAKLKSDDPLIGRASELKLG
ncbi:MAG: hypothetical protein EXR72_14260 [Myxococcales bacterium]|nr:hypothetical protein [Myxococcales bacterium]